MINLTMYSDNELSLQVFNDQYFYSERNHNGNSDYILALVAEEFVYTPKQLEVLKEDLAADRKEMALLGEWSNHRCPQCGGIECDYHINQTKWMKP